MGTANQIRASLPQDYRITLKDLEDLKSLIDLSFRNDISPERQHTVLLEAFAAVANIQEDLRVKLRSIGLRSLRSINPIDDLPQE